MSGLKYAGARFYDPEMGMFLTHDPARQFANPYAYGPWDPINGSDPSGSLWVVAVLLFAASVGASFAQALASGASLKEAGTVALQAAIIGGITAAGMGIVGGFVQAASAGTQVAVGSAMTGYGAYTTVRSFQTGQFIVGGLGALMSAFGLIALAHGVSGLRGAGSQGPGNAAAEGTTANGNPVDPFTSYMDRCALEEYAYTATELADYFDEKPENGDGVITFGEAKWQWQHGEGMGLTADLNKIRFQDLDLSRVATRSTVAFTPESYSDFLVHGKVDLQFASDGSLVARSAPYDFDIVVSRSVTRNIETFGAHLLHGPGEPFLIHYRGSIRVGGKAT